MAKKEINNLLSFKEYGNFKFNDKLKKLTKRTGIGGDILNENVEIANMIAALINDASFQDQLKVLMNSLSPKVKSLIKKYLDKDVK